MQVQPKQKILVAGATGSIGKHVVTVALEAGFSVRALTRNKSSGFVSSPCLEVVYGDLTKPATLHKALDDVDAVVFTHGSYGDSKAAQAVDYGAVKNVLAVLCTRQVRIALMTTIGATDRKGAHDWKRRGEWLVRASGLPYTIVRPAWFDWNKEDEQNLLMLQGDKPLVGSPKDGVISRRQLAEVLVRSLSSKAALRKTFELHAVKGHAQSDFEPIFSALDADTVGSIHGAHDIQNMPINEEPSSIQNDIREVQARNCNTKKHGVDIDGR